jgi:glutamate-1-semialdehyde 2,1-aminomutase
MNTNWTWTAGDEAAAAALRARLPDRLFDAHAHLYRSRDIGTAAVALEQQGPSVAGAAVWREHVGRQVGAARLAGALMIPFPSATCDIEQANAFVLAEQRANPACRALVLVAPRVARESVEALVAAGGVAGFKPYHLMGAVKPTFQAPISTFTPLWAWELADRHRLVILLHMVRDRALDDPDNQREIRDLCTRFPNAHLILAHAARGFHAPNTVRGLPALQGLDNISFDASGICEPEAIRAIIEACGPRRLMWGSDFPISERRGRCVTVGDGFAWINPDRIDDHPQAPALETWPVGLENLRALLQAADDCGLNAADMLDIFHDNAARLFGLAAESGTVTQDTYRRACRVIPGGTHLLSKRPEMFAPGQWPAYFREARGCDVWDLDGRRYTDFSLNGVGACLLGYRDAAVTRAVRRRASLGNLSTLNPAEEVDLAERLVAMHPWASRVRFARTGGELAAVAVRIARATTDRSCVAICGYHGWSDWYLAANLGADDSLRGHLLPGLDPLGVPRELRGTAFTFTYNNREQLRKIVAEHGDRLAAVVMEPCRSEDPAPGFLEFVRDTARQAGALLIFDEITIGFRLAFGGAHLKFGVNPDMALYGKTLGNGYPIAAVVGTAEAMEGAHASFISSSYWTEGIGPAAALATLDRLREADAVGHAARIGALIQTLWRDAARRHGLPVTVKGYPAIPIMTFDHEQAVALKTLYIQEMLARGYLAGPMIYVTLAHTEATVERFAGAVDAVFATLAAALADGDVAKRLKGPAAHAGFQRLL